MPEEQSTEQAKQPVPQAPAAPLSFPDFFARNFRWFLACIAILVALFVVPIKHSSGITAPFLDTNQFAIGLLCIILAFYIIPQMVFSFGKKPQQMKLEIIDPEEEAGKIMERMAAKGHDVRIDYWEGGIFEGAGEEQQTVMHYYGHETLLNGVVKPIHFTQSIAKVSTRFMPGRHIETHEFSRAGSRKRPKEAISTEPQRLFKPAPVQINLSLPERKGEIKKEEKEEEGEGEQ